MLNAAVAVNSIAQESRNGLFMGEDLSGVLAARSTRSTALYFYTLDL
jgi:hypothetical protein